MKNKYIGIDWKAPKKESLKEIMAKHDKAIKSGFVPKKLIKDLK